MFNNGSIYNAVQTIIRKDVSGNTFSPEEMTSMLILCMHEKDNADFKQYETHQIITDSLRNLEVTYVAFVVGGNASLPDNYWHVKEKGIVVSGYPADVVTEKEWQERSYSAALQPKVWCPIARIIGDNIQIYPASEGGADVDSILIEYLKNPTDPYFDYYYDANDNIQYLTPSTAYTLKTGETYIDKDDGTERVAGYVIASGEVKSVELHFPESDRVDVMYKILEKLGVSLNDQLKLQYGMQREIKEETK